MALSAPLRKLLNNITPGAKTAKLGDRLAAALTPPVAAVGSSRALTIDDDGQVLECTAASLTLTVPKGLPVGFSCKVIPNGTTSIASDAVALINGATTTLTRAAAGNPIVSIHGRVSALDSYVVTGS